MKINGYEFEIEQSDEYTAALQNGEAPKLDMHKSLVLSQIKAEMRKIGLQPEDQFEYTPDLCICLFVVSTHTDLARSAGRLGACSLICEGLGLMLRWGQVCGSQR